MKTVNVLKIADLKTGAGVQVTARHNSQLLLYALMARLDWGPIYGPFDQIELHIVQPALNHIDVWVIGPSELDAFEQTVQATLARINRGDREAVPGEKQCRFCRAKPVCSAHAQYQLDTAKADFIVPPITSAEEVLP